MASYEIRDYTNTIYLVIYSLLWGILIILLYLYSYIPAGTVLLFYEIAIPVLVIPIILYWKKVEVEIKIDHECLDIKWVSQPFLFKKKDMKIEWSEIKEYVFVPIIIIEIFKIKFRNGNKIKLIQFDRKDYFYKKFKIKWRDTVQSINEESNEKIKKGKAIFIGIALLLSIVFIMFAILIAFCLSPFGGAEFTALVFVYVPGGAMFLFLIVIADYFMEEFKADNMIKKKKEE